MESEFAAVQFVTELLQRGLHIVLAHLAILAGGTGIPLGGLGEDLENLPRGQGLALGEKQGAHDLLHFGENVGFSHG